MSETETGVYFPEKSHVGGAAWLLMKDGADLDRYEMWPRRLLVSLKPQACLGLAAIGLTSIDPTSLARRSSAGKPNRRVQQRQLLAPGVGTGFDPLAGTRRWRVYPAMAGLQLAVLPVVRKESQ